MCTITGTQVAIENNLRLSYITTKSTKRDGFSWKGLKCFKEIIYHLQETSVVYYTSAHSNRWQAESKILGGT